MLQSRNVTLRRSSDAPLRHLRDVYGSEDDAETQLERIVLAGERRIKGHAPPLTEGPDTAHLWTAVVGLLNDLSAYGALGTMGGADQRFCQRLQPLLTRLMKGVLSGGFEVTSQHGDAPSEDDEAETPYDAEALLQAASKALANCSGGVTRRCADTTFEVQLDSHGATVGASNQQPNGEVVLNNVEGTRADTESCKEATLQVCFGFADYTSGETGAMLWAGAVGLSLYLVENYNSLILHRAREVFARAGRPLRVIELGCGPALVSLVIAAMAARETSRATTPALPCCLDVTDVSPTVVAEATRSFEQRNGPALRCMLTGAAVGGEATETRAAACVDACSDTDGSRGNEQAAAAAPTLDHVKDGNSNKSSFRVHPFTLDFGAIPSHLCGIYDLVVASDVVYDHAIAANVAPALEALLKPGGTALLCCEAHRDGMAYFTSRIRAGHPEASHLRVVEEVRDVQTALSRLRMLTSLTASTCSLMRIEKMLA